MRSMRACHHAPGGLSPCCFTAKGNILQGEVHVRVRHTFNGQQSHLVRRCPDYVHVSETNIINGIRVWTKLSDVSKVSVKLLCFSDFWKCWHKWLHSCCWLWDRILLQRPGQPQVQDPPCVASHVPGFLAGSIISRGLYSKPDNMSLNNILWRYH